jgi:hypothetical protein
MISHYSSVPASHPAMLGLPGAGALIAINSMWCASGSRARGQGWPAQCENHGMQTPLSPPQTPPIQVRNPLHGLTLEAIVTALVDYYGWAGLGERIPVRCFLSEPSVTSSLKFLRKTPWAREKVEGLYLFMRRERRRAGG